MILFVDPGSKKAGAALYSPEGLLMKAWLAEGDDWVGTANAVLAGVPYPTITTSAGRAGLFTPQFRVTEVVIEKMECYKHMPIPVEDLITLSLMSGRVTGFFHGANVVEYLPKTWKKQTRKDIKISRIQEAIFREERERIEFARNKNGSISKRGQNDIWDAVGMGQYHLRRERRKLRDQEEA